MYREFKKSKICDVSLKIVEFFVHINTSLVSKSKFIKIEESYSLKFYYPLKFVHIIGPIWGEIWIFFIIYFCTSGKS